MPYYQTTQKIVAKGVFITSAFGYFSFELDNKELLFFEEVNCEVLEKYDLRSEKFSNHLFKLFYTIIVDDLDNDDFVTLRLDDLISIRINS